MPDLELHIVIEGPVDDELDPSDLPGIVFGLPTVFTAPAGTPFPRIGEFFDEDWKLLRPSVPEHPPQED